MPQVPYDPTPNVRPSGQGTPYLSVPVTGAAFGVNVGEAEQRLGGELEKAGDRLASDVIYAQNLQNEADVNQATTDYLIKSGELDNQFRLLQGKDPQAKLQDHVSALRDLRESTRESLKNPMAQKMFDRETMRRFGYDVINASNYSATQMKQYTNQSYEANQLSMADRAAKDPYNEAYLHEVIQSTIDSEAKLSADNGDPPELTKMKIQNKVGRAIGGVATSLAKNDPDRAIKFLDQFKDKISEADYLKYRETLLDRSVQYHSALDARRAVGGADTGVLDLRKAGKNVRTEQLTPEMRSRASEAITAAEEASGGQAVIESATRTTAEQAALRRRYETGAGGLAAPPGTSRHEFGEAIDLQSGPVLNKLREWYKSGELQEKYGLTMLPDRANDPGHLQLAEGSKPIQVAGPAPEVTLPDVMRKGEEYARQRFPDDPIRQEKYTEQFQSHIQRNATLARTQINQTIKANRLAIDSVLFNTAGGDRGPTSIEEASRIDPTFQDKLDAAVKLQPSIQKHVNDTFNYNAKMDVPYTQERFDRFEALRGLRFTNPDEFLATSLASLDLPRKQYNEAHGWQLQDAKRLRDTSHLNAALRVLTPMLNDAGILPSRTDPTKAAVYNQLVGALEPRLEEAQTKKGARLNENEIMEIGAGLITRGGQWRFSNPGWFGDKDFNFQVPQDAKDRLTKGFKSYYNTTRDPTPTELFMMYERETKKNARTRP